MFVHTVLGHSIYEKIKDDFIWCRSEVKSIIEQDGDMVEHSVSLNPLRDEFFCDLNTLEMADVERKYLDCSIKRKFIAKTKPFLYKIGVFNLYMKMKRCL